MKLLTTAPEFYMNASSTDVSRWKLWSVHVSQHAALSLSIHTPLIFKTHASNNWMKRSYGASVKPATPTLVLSALTASTSPWRDYGRVHAYCMDVDFRCDLTFKKKKRWSHDRNKENEACFIINQRAHDAGLEKQNRLSNKSTQP